MPNRELVVTKDTTVHYEIDTWRDLFLPDKWAGLSAEKADTSKLNIFITLAMTYISYPEVYNSDSAYYYAGQSVQLLQKLKAADYFKTKKFDDYAATFISLQEVAATALHSVGNFAKSLEIRLENLQVAEKLKDKPLTFQPIQILILTGFASTLFRRFQAKPH